MTEKLSAKEILKNKFWIVESEGEKVATLSIGDDSQLMYSSNNTGTRFYKNIKALTKNLNADITWSPIETVTVSLKNLKFTDLALVALRIIQCSMLSNVLHYLQKAKSLRACTVQVILSLGLTRVG